MDFKASISICMALCPRIMIIRTALVCTRFSLLAADDVTVLADQDRRTDSPLPAVVVRRYLFVIQEGEQFLAVASQPLLQPSGVLLLPFLVDELVQTLPNSNLPSFIALKCQTLFVFLQPHTFPNQAAQSLVKL